MSESLEERLSRYELLIQELARYGDGDYWPRIAQDAIKQTIDDVKSQPDPFEQLTETESVYVWRDEAGTINWEANIPCDNDEEFKNAVIGLLFGGMMRALVQHLDEAGIEPTYDYLAAEVAKRLAP